MQLRTFVAAFLIGLPLAWLAGAASAQQIYTWKDAQGVTHFSQSPPAGSARYTKMKLANAPEVSSNPPPPPAANAPNASASPAPQAAAAGATQPDTPANRAELCKQLGSNITLLEGKQPVVTAGENGKQTILDDNARQQQLATARAQQAQYCSQP